MRKTFELRRRVNPLSDTMEYLLDGLGDRYLSNGLRGNFVCGRELDGLENFEPGMPRVSGTLSTTPPEDGRTFYELVTGLSAAGTNTLKLVKSREERAVLWNTTAETIISAFELYPVGIRTKVYFWLDKPTDT